MQLFNAITILALAMTATAVPAMKDAGTVIAARHDGDDHTALCCNPVGHNCRIDNDCSRPFRTYCCDTRVLAGVSSPSLATVHSLHPAWRTPRV